MMMRSRNTSFLFGGNAPYVEEQYEAYLADRDTVSEEWRGYVDALQGVPAVDGSDAGDVAHAPVVSRFVELARQARTGARTEDEVLGFARKQVAVQALISVYRMVGTRNAHLNPLRWTAPRGHEHEVQHDGRVFFRRGRDAQRSGAGADRDILRDAGRRVYASG